MVPPPEARGGPGGAGGVAGAASDGRESVRKVHGEVVGYFENHVHRMDYPTYRAKGWAIGSGSDRIGVQDGHRQADEGGRDALGRGRGR